RRAHRIGSVFWHIAAIAPVVPARGGAQHPLAVRPAPACRVDAPSPYAGGSPNAAPRTLSWRRSNLGGTGARTSRGATAPRSSCDDTPGSTTGLLLSRIADGLRAHAHVVAVGGAIRGGQANRRPLLASVLGSGCRGDALPDAAAYFKRRRSDEGPRTPVARPTLPSPRIGAAAQSPSDFVFSVVTAPRRAGAGRCGRRLPSALGAGSRRWPSDERLCPRGVEAARPATSANLAPPQPRDVDPIAYITLKCSTTQRTAA